MPSNYKNNKKGMGMYKFPISKKHISMHKKLPNQATGLTTFYISSTPTIPESSLELKNLLHSYDNIAICSSSGESSKSGTSPKKLIKVKTKISKPKRLNGFIAFRSYYSKSINNPSLQRQLSKELAQLWLKEPQQNIWKRYAIEYNRSCENVPFIEWLDSRTGKPTDPIEGQKQNIDDVLSENISLISDVILQFEGITFDFENSFNSGLDDLQSAIDRITKHPYDYEQFTSTQYVDDLDNLVKKELSRSVDSYINDPKFLKEFLNETLLSLS